MKSLKAFLKQKSGMTFVEILVAMSVLMLVIVSFTPMLLHAYDSLYTAGEINEKTYDAKSVVEEGLATRSSTDILYNIQTNFKTIGDVVSVNLRRAASASSNSLKEGIETLFYGSKGTVKIISGKRVNDDKIEKTVLVKTSGIVIDKAVIGNAGSAEIQKTGKTYKYTVAISVIAPDWEKGGSETQAYDLSKPLTKVTCSGPDDKGMITVKIPNQDLTNSPLKIIVYYYDENTKLNNTGTAPASGEAPREATTFLYIDPPTLLLAGKTDSTGTYYTSAGIEELNGGKTAMTVDKRVMTEAGNFHVPGVGSTVIKNVTWVDNDPTDDYDNYYVLTGTNGAIMRLYPSLTVGGFGKIRDDTGTAESKKPVTISDAGLDKLIYPTLWGGDYSHQFMYSSYSTTDNKKSQTDYGAKNSDRDDDRCWRTETGAHTGIGQAGIYGTQAQYSYQYNGMEVAFEYNVQKRRCISYILTESGWALRLAGDKLKADDFNGYQTPWEHCGKDWNYYDYSATAYKVIRFHPQTAITRKPNVKDNSIANIAVKSLNSFSVTEALRDDDGRSGYIINQNTDTAKQVVVTDATYIPSLGKMFYLGNIGAYSEVMQLDNTNTKQNYAQEYVYFKAFSSATIFTGSFSGYLFMGANDGSGTTVYKKVESSGDFDAIVKKGWYTQISSLVDLGSDTSKHIKQGETDKQNAFYVNRSNGSAFFPDVLFTLGFSSNREVVYSNITYDGQNEYYKSYEPYYWLSHYGTQSKTPNFAVVGGVNNEDKATGGLENRNIPNNDYYNVWFPGEMYNLTKTVTKGGVTVAVGYTVSGSSYQYINPSQITNTSTALGGVFNDGVLAVMTDQSSKFRNLLYFKDNATMDADYLTTDNTEGKSNYASVYGTYGTHVRDSVRFTAVDIQLISSGNAGSYYAYYGDNTGRVFKSLVATSDANGNISPVTFIADTTYAGTESAPSTMEELKLNGASLSNYFKSISTIVCNDSIVVISGVPRDSSAYGNAVVAGVEILDEESRPVGWQFGLVKLAPSNYKTNAAKIVDGNYYAAGTYGTDKGFLLGVPFDKIKVAVQTGTSSLYSESPKDNKVLIYDKIDTPIYAMDGRGANG